LIFKEEKMVSAFLATALLGSTWPRRGIHDGDNRISWTPGCCDGDLVIVDFHDSQGDGNSGNGLLHVSNSTSGYDSTYVLGCVLCPAAQSSPCVAARGRISRARAQQPRESISTHPLSYLSPTSLLRGRSCRSFWGTWKTFGPFCAPEGEHNITFSSDANPSETTVTVTDSFGLIRAKGGMADFPITFSTGAPNKFCDPEGGLTDDQKIKRARKLVAYHDQWEPRSLLERRGREVPQDQGLSVYPNE
tara:strand:- start:106 stop:846 length:741 start_codon:yes stop_codon:yes gene_type:complete